MMYALSLLTVLIIILGLLWFAYRRRKVYPTVTTESGEDSTTRLPKFAEPKPSCRLCFGRGWIRWTQSPVTEVGKYRCGCTLTH